MRFESASPLQNSISPIQPWAFECRSRQQQRTRFNAGRGESSKCQIEMDTPCKQILPSKARFSSSSLDVRADAQSGRGTRSKKKKLCMMWNANQDDDELNLRFQNEVRRLGHLNGTVLRWNENCVLFWFSVVSIFSLWATALPNIYCFAYYAHFTNWYILIYTFIG